MFPHMLCVLTWMGIGGWPMPAQGADPTKIVLLGTLHGAHRKNARYSADILRDLIVKLKPAAILVELPPAIGGEATLELIKVEPAGDWRAAAAPMPRPCRRLRRNTIVRYYSGPELPKLLVLGTDTVA